MVVTDNKALYDGLMKKPILASDDKRTAIEAAAIRQGLEWTKTDARWIHSLANPADGLTKDEAKSQEALLRLVQKKCWRLVHDPNFESSRKRQASGKSPFAEDDDHRA